MALIRCNACGKPEGRKRTYLECVEPIGYPDTAAICGLRHCERPGMVWLEPGELQAYRGGKRVFTVPNAAVKIKVK
jgi:hypothetical protein